MTDRFVKVPCQILQARDLSSTDKLTWCAIASFCYDGKPTCFPSHEKIGAKVGKSRLRILASVQKLLRGGYLKVTKTGHRTCEYEPCLPVANSEHVAETEQVSEPILMSVSKTEHVEPMSIENETGPVSKTEHKVEELKKKEKSTPLPPKKKKRPQEPKKDPSRDPVFIQEQLDRINLDVYRKQYKPRGLDVDSTWEDFCQSCLGNDPKLPGINPRNYVNFGGAFHTWCKLRLEWRRDRAGPMNAKSDDDDSWKYPRV